MSLFEHAPLPGAPYVIASVVAVWAFLHSFELPDDAEVVHAKYGKGRYADSIALLSDDESI